MANTTRQYRVADQIQRELALLIRDEVRDPRVSPFATICEVEVTSDLSLARIYVSAVDDDESNETVPALQKAAGFLRRKLASIMKLRHMPELRFILDDTALRAESISRVINDAVERDRKLSDNDSE